MTELDIAKKVAQVLYDRKADDIAVIRVAHLTSLADYLVIATAHNALQIKALYEHLSKELEALDVPVRRADGLSDAHWVVLDLGSVIVHLFDPENRAFYHLERLWEDGRNRVALPFDEEVALA